MIAALLLGRKGSVEFPGKNLFPVLGKPMVFYPMKAALKSKNVDNVYISTDDEGLMDLARDNGVEVIVKPGCLENIEQGLLPQKWMGQKIYPLKQWGGCDVDYEWQLPGIEFWLRSHGFSDDCTSYS